MNKVKWILRTVTICCVVLPLLFTVLIYKDNLLGLILPPQVMAAMSGQGNNQSAMQQVLPDLGNLSDLQPTYNNDFQFNTNDDSFTVSFTINNPLNSTISVNTISLTVTDGNGTTLGTIQLDHPISLLPGQNSSVPIEGALSPDFVGYLQSNGVDLTNFNPENMTGSNFDPSGLHLTNVELDIGGIQVHVDDLSLANLGGMFGSGNQSSDESNSQEGGK